VLAEKWKAKPESERVYPEYVPEKKTFEELEREAMEREAEARAKEAEARAKELAEKKAAAKVIPARTSLSLVSLPTSMHIFVN